MVLGVKDEIRMGFRFEDYRLTQLQRKIGDEVDAAADAFSDPADALGDGPIGIAPRPSPAPKFTTKSHSPLVRGRIRQKSL